MLLSLELSGSPLTNICIILKRQLYNIYKFSCKVIVHSIVNLVFLCTHLFWILWERPAALTVASMSLTCPFPMALLELNYCLWCGWTLVCLVISFFLYTLIWDLWVCLNLMVHAFHHSGILPLLFSNISLLYCPHKFQICIWYTYCLFSPLLLIGHAFLMYLPSHAENP